MLLFFNLYGIFPYLKVANLSYTHLYTTMSHPKMQNRTISMCQVLGQRSIRAIIKLKKIFFFVY